MNKKRIVSALICLVCFVAGLLPQVTYSDPPVTTNSPVTTTGNQNISGTKNFTGTVQIAGIALGTAATHAATDFYLTGGALGTPSSGTLTNCAFPTLNQNTSGSAAKLTTARTINGLSFDGSANASGAFTSGSIGAGFTAIADAYISSAATWNAKQAAITTGSTAQYFRGDLSLATLNAAAVGLGNLTNSAITAGSISLGNGSITFNAAGQITAKTSPTDLQTTDGVLNFAGFSSITNVSSLPTLNQNTTGSAGSVAAANVTGTLAAAQGGTGQTSLANAETAFGIPAKVVDLNAYLINATGGPGVGNGLDSNIDTGGGHDCTSNLNTLLATATATNPLEIVVQGVGLVSGTIQLNSYCHLRGVSGHCGFYLAANSNCILLSNNLSGTSITAYRVFLTNIELNCGTQAKYQGNVNTETYLAQAGSSSNTSFTITLSSPISGYNTNAQRVVRGQTVTCDSPSTDIPANTLVSSITDSTHVVLTNAAVGSNSHNFDFRSGAFERVTSWNFGIWFSGFDHLVMRDVLVRNAPTFSWALSNGTDFSMENCRCLWDDNTGPVTLTSGATNIATTTVTMTSANPGVVTWPSSHGFLAGTPIIFTTTGGLPTNIVSGTTYYVSASNLTSTTFRLANNSADALASANSIDTTAGAQSGVQSAKTPGLITYATDPNYGAANAYVRHSSYVSDSPTVNVNIPSGTFIGTVLSATRATLVNGSGNPVNAIQTASSLTFRFIPQTNNNRDGVHMFGNLVGGSIKNFRGNNDDDVIAFNTDEAANLNDPRRGTGNIIRGIVVDGVYLDNATNAGFRFWGSNGTGVLDGITLNNFYGNTIAGIQGCSGTAPSPAYGRLADSGIASIGTISISNFSAVDTITDNSSATNVNLTVLNAASLSYDLQPSQTITTTGSTISQKVPQQSNAFNQQLGTMMNQTTAKSASFTVGLTDRGKLFDITTGSSQVIITPPVASDAGNGFSFLVRKVDSGTGYLNTTFSSPTITTQYEVELIWSNGTTWNYQVLTGNVNTSSRYLLNYPTYLTSNDSTNESLRVENFNINSLIATWYYNGTKLGDVHPSAGLEFTNGNFSGTLTASGTLSAYGGGGIGTSDALGRTYFGTSSVGNGFFQEWYSTGAGVIGGITAGGSMNLTGASTYIYCPGRSSDKMAFQTNTWDLRSSGSDFAVNVSGVMLDVSTTAVNTPGDFITTAIGKTLKVKSGTNAKSGTFTLVGGTATIANTSVTANSVIYPTLKTAGGTRNGLPDIVPTAGTGFVATEIGGVLDTSTYNYVIIEVN